jgi:hypothetical protein
MTSPSAARLSLTSFSSRSSTRRIELSIARNLFSSLCASMGGSSGAVLMASGTDLRDERLPAELGLMDSRFDFITSTTVIPPS